MFGSAPREGRKNFWCSLKILVLEMIEGMVQRTVHRMIHGIVRSAVHGMIQSIAQGQGVAPTDHGVGLPRHDLA